MRNATNSFKICQKNYTEWPQKIWRPPPKYSKFLNKFDISEKFQNFPKTQHFSKISKLRNILNFSGFHKNFENSSSQNFQIFRLKIFKIFTHFMFYFGSIGRRIFDNTRLLRPVVNILEFGKYCRIIYTCFRLCSFQHS